MVALSPTDFCGLSPRGRGKLPVSANRWELRGSIPAWAGETLTPPLGKSFAGVYPRVGGGNDGGVGHADDMGGLSPRGRGKHRHPPAADHAKRSIPAWAGETGA